MYNSSYNALLPKILERRGISIIVLSYMMLKKTGRYIKKYIIYISAHKANRGTNYRHLLASFSTRLTASEPALCGESVNT